MCITTSIEGGRWCHRDKTKKKKSELNENVNIGRMNWNICQHPEDEEFYFQVHSYVNKLRGFYRYQISELFTKLKEIM